jgi:two-component system, OmpR family, sensor histidine kinase PhoQ
MIIRRMLSLQARQLLAASLGLVAFLGLTGYALDRAFAETAEATLRQRLENYLWAYLRGTEGLRSGELVVPETPPDPRFGHPGSGLYAGLASDKFKWESDSALERGLPFADQLPPGEWRYDGPITSTAGDIYRYSFGTAWEIGEGREVAFTLHVAEDTVAMDRQIAVFRRTLWGYLGAAAGLLLLLQVLVLRWSLSPLRRVVGDMEQIMDGRRERLPGGYPLELTLLTDSLNEMIDVGRDQIGRTRNILADLAHSLKTPLAVMRSELESDHDDAALRAGLKEQIGRMGEIVAYQLSRAATSGRQTFATPLPLEPRAEEIVRSLEKVYASKNILCEFDVDRTARFHGEQGDLMELLGNLLENAFKWADHRVLLTCRAMTIAPQRRSGLLITVEDDGPGIPPNKVDLLLQRGVRGDERVHGHGIGLAIVQDIVKAYRGELTVEHSDELGGARFVVSFSPTM